MIDRACAPPACVAPAAPKPRPGRLGGPRGRPHLPELDGVVVVRRVHDECEPLAVMLKADPSRLHGAQPAYSRVRPCDVEADPVQPDVRGVEELWPPARLYKVPQRAVVALLEVRVGAAVQADVPCVHRRLALGVVPEHALVGAGKVLGPVALHQGRDGPPHVHVHPKHRRDIVRPIVPPYPVRRQQPRPLVRRRKDHALCPVDVDDYLVGVHGLGHEEAERHEVRGGHARAGHKPVVQRRSARPAAVFGHGIEYVADLFAAGPVPERRHDVLGQVRPALEPVRR